MAKRHHLEQDAGPDAEDDDNTPLEEAEDVSLRPGQNADAREDFEHCISADVRDLYDVYSYGHAATILKTSFPTELAEIEEALRNFRITVTDIGMPGGNESIIPKKYSRTLRPLNWTETRIRGDLAVKMEEYDEVFLRSGKVRKTKRSESVPRVIKDFVDGHKIDYVKGRVAFDLEWNSKDQTFDRDLYAMRVFHECGIISAGVLVTRSAKLNPIFQHVPKLTKEGETIKLVKGPHAGELETVRAKYGASTTWMGKLLYRLNAGRHGGCPMLVFGITPALIEDYP